jgi:CRISPR-associated protein Csb2
MPTVLQLRFPARRYHATPWEHHVNEGTVEWPPSPWRLLRALLATGFAKCGWDAAAPPDVARGLIEALAAHPPAFALPPACLGHSRHYVEAAEKKPLIIDAWARIETDAPPLELTWPCDLEPAQRELLGELARLLGYLGRAESWVDARLASRAERAINCAPGEVDASDTSWEAVRVLCPLPAPTYASWRADASSRIDQATPRSATKSKTRGAKNRARALTTFPGDLVAALCAETGHLQRAGWTRPPGSQQVTYRRSRTALEVSPVAAPRRFSAPTVPFALLAIATSTRNRSALPAVDRVFPQGVLLHRALASAVARVGAASQALRLLGRDRGQVARGHRHAHLLYLDLDGDRRLDHALLWLPDGIDEMGLRALRSVRRTWMKGGVGELQVALAAAGDARLLRGLGRGAARDGLAAVLGPSDRWVSATPFVAPRFVKGRGKDTLEGQILAALAHRDLPPATIEILPQRAASALSFRHYVLHSSDKSPPRRVSHSVRLTFERPITGPLCIGYGSHYGLGRFVAE